MEELKEKINKLLSTINSESLKGMNINSLDISFSYDNSNKSVKLSYLD